MGLSVVLTGCSLLSPYQITFTTKENEPVDPKVETLDLVISSPALAYVSSYQCGDAEEVTLLPVLKDDMVAQMAQYIDINFLADQAANTLCQINVTAFDRTTTSTSNKKISVYMYSKPLLKAKENEFCGGIAAIQCEEGFTCKMSGDFPDAGGTCATPEVKTGDEVVTEQLKLSCVESGGEWKECTDPADATCKAKCAFIEKTTVTPTATETTESTVTTTPQ